MSTRARLRVAAAVAVLSAVGIAVLVVQLVSSGGDRAPVPLGLRERTAVAPFSGLREVRADLDGRCRRLVVADTSASRASGLRGRADLGVYAGMLFVTRRDTDEAFTMAGVSQPLEIGWYSAAGRRVGTAHLRPCPRQTESRCPVYRSRRRYRLALETPGGVPTPNVLSPC